jgi:hypothetical protein
MRTRAEVIHSFHTVHRISEKSGDDGGKSAGLARLSCVKELES